MDILKSGDNSEFDKKDLNEMERHITTPRDVNAYKGKNDKHKESKELTTNIKNSNKESKDIEVEKSVKELPDIVIDIPELKLEQVNIQAKNLQAEVSMNTSLKEMVNMNFGVEAQIGSLHIKIDKARTEAHLRFRLKRVRGILNKTVQTLVKNIGTLKTHLVDQSSDKPLSRLDGEELNKKEIEEAIQSRVTKSFKKDE
ncbi:hypothetical protein [Sporocytophaga myxococcoides]|uniref:hypothetical protein n=1 Tax=Sporocytophaga myxococcoides TaxID=153721 RepID=UPI0012E0512D|nr:hypothetical protein [Sporocytophaga myxococcoides]